MLIKFTFQKLPVDEAGVAYASLDEFKVALLKKLFIDARIFEDDKLELNLAAAKGVVALRGAVLEVLELTMDARPAARGVKKPRKPKAPAVVPDEGKAA